MLNKIKGCLWLQLSLWLGAALAGIFGAAYTLVSEGHVPVRDVILLCLVTSVVACAAVLRGGLTPLRDLADAAQAISEGQPLTIRSTSTDDVGRLTQALRSLQASVQVAMSRMTGVDGGGSSSTGSWSAIVIGSDDSKRSRLRRVGTVAAKVAGIALYGALTVCLFVRPPMSSSSPSRARMVEMARVAAPATSPAMPTAQVRGVTKDMITLGMSAPFTGGPRSLSDGMKLGLDVAFAETNAAGGVHGRKINLIALDNGYEEARALETTRDLVENRRVFGMIGNVGTPTVKAVLSYLNANKVILFGPLTGSPVTRNDPPDRYVFNVRASYATETATMVSYLVDVKKIPAKSIVVFAQNDSFGDAGYDGAVKTLRKKGHTGELLRVGYDRNSADVTEAASRVLAYHAANQKSGGVRAVIVVATTTASASFTAKIASIGAIVLNVSFVDAGQLSLEFHDHWPGVGEGVIVTEVVPHFDSGATGVIRYRDALKLYAPDKAPGFASLEGYVVGMLFAEGLRQAGPNLDVERVVDALEKVRDLDLGTGGAYSFGPSRHWASQKVWGTILTANGTFKPLDSEWAE